MSGMRMGPRVDLPLTLFKQMGVKRMAALYLMLIAASCVPANSSYRTVTGLRGPQVTVAIDPLPVGQIAPSIASTPLTPVEFDPSTLPALDAITNPLLAEQNLTVPVGLPGALAMPMPIPAQPLPDYRAMRFNTGPAVSAFAFRGSTATDSMRSQLCLAAAIYYEAASESDDGQRAVAQVVLNRARHPAYPNTVCDVVYQGTERGDRLCQFSFACDGSMARLPSRDGWARASRIARAALAGYVFPNVGTATHYHTLAVNPYWNKSLTAVNIIGAHIFYRWGNAAGQPGAFYARYSGREPTPGPRPHPIRSLVTPYQGTPYPTQIGQPSIVAGAPLPAAIPDASLAAIEARANQSLLAQQAALAQATARQLPAQRPTAQDNRYVSGALPDSNIRPEFENSGQWIGK
jgi:Cell Wall Hydrolase